MPYDVTDTSDRVAAPEPMILLIGAGPVLRDALLQALTCRGVCVEAISTDLAQEAVEVAAPDLVVLADEAAQDAGVAALARLASSPVSSVVPVVVLGDSPTLAERLEAFRCGAVAVLELAPGIDATADTLAELTREIPERNSQNLAELGESTLRDFVQALSQRVHAEGRSQRLSSGLDEDVRFVFGGGQPLAKLWVTGTSGFVRSAGTTYRSWPWGTSTMIRSTAPCGTTPMHGESGAT